LPNTHPNYLVYRSDSHLYLNIIDPPVPLFKLDLFRESIAFIDEYMGVRNILVHCNQAQSRSPSICLIYLAVIGVVPANTYREAAEAFLALYPAYSPGQGIQKYLDTNWRTLLDDGKKTVA